MGLFFAYTQAPNLLLKSRQFIVRFRHAPYAPPLVAS